MLELEGADVELLSTAAEDNAVMEAMVAVEVVRGLTEETPLNCRAALIAPIQHVVNGLT